MSYLLAAALLCGAGMRFWLKLDSGLWEDEVIAVTHAVQPLPYFFVNIVRNDIHPPLYFLQLHLWSLVSQTDAWFAANSVAWGLAAIASLMTVLRRSSGTMLGLAAAAFLAVLPSGLWMSQEIRPYAWLSVLYIWLYALALDCFGRPAHSRRLHGALLLLCLVVIYSHAVGFLAVMFNGLFALCHLMRRRAQRRDVLAWAAVYGTAALGSLPQLATNLLHDANLGSATTLMDALSWCPAVIFGNEVEGASWWLGIFAYLGIAGVGMAVARTRLVAGCFLIAPLLVACLLATGLKPIFKPNFFATLMAPFFAIVLAETTAALRPALRMPIVSGLLGGLFAMAVAGWVGKHRSADFLPAAVDLRANLQPGDTIYVPQNVMFWGLARYLAGPQWGSTLEVANPPNAQWSKVYTRLGPKVIGLLHLQPTTQVLKLPNQVNMMLGDESQVLAEAHSRVWLVVYPRADAPPGYPPDRLGGLEKRRGMEYRSLVVSLYEGGR